ILVDIEPEFYSHDPLFGTFGGSPYIPLYVVLDVCDKKEEGTRKLNEINSHPSKKTRILENPVRSEQRKAKLYVCDWDIQKYENAIGAYFYTVSFYKKEDGSVENNIIREQSEFQKLYRLKIQNRKFQTTVLAKSKEEALTKAKEVIFDFILILGNKLI